VRFLGTLALALAAIGCAPAQESAAPTRPTATPISASQSPRNDKVPPYYMITARRSITSDESAPELRFSILDGVRLVTQHGKLERAFTITEPPLRGVARIPEHLGAGYLFWNQNALYRAQTFTGELVGLAGLGVAPQKVMFGPTSALVQTEHGSVYVDPKTGANRSESVKGVVDVASLSDGRAVALTAVGDVLVSRDGGKHWTSARERLQAPVRELREHEGDLWIFEQGSEALRYDTSGQLTRHPAPSRPNKQHADRRWTLDQTPLETAAGAGVMVDQTRALVALNGAVVTIDLQSGALLAFGRALLPSAADCRLLRGGELLMVCAKPRPTVVRDPLGAAVIERSFADGTELSFADGMLAFGASCEGGREPGRVCVRSLNAEYRDYDRRTEIAGLAAPGTEAGKVELAVEWVPKRGGGALGVVKRPHAALIDAATGSVVPIPKPNAERWLAALASPDPSPITSSRVATADGRLVGYGANQSFAVGADGQLGMGGFEFAAVEGFAGRALAVDRSPAARYFESTDFGVTWAEVERPPGPSNAQGCSEVGCRSDAWLRFGWGAVSPTPPVPPRVVRPPPLRERPKLPKLSCEEQQAPAVSSKRLSVPFGSEETSFDFGFGARQVLMSRGSTWHYRELFAAQGDSDFGLWALLYARVPEVAESNSGPVPASPNELLREKSIHYVQPFDARAKVSTSKLTWKNQAEAATRVGGLYPSLQVADQEWLTALPVVAAPPNFSSGLLLDEAYGPSVWVREGEPRPISLGQDRDELEIIDAATPGRGELTLLLRGDDGQSLVIAAGAKRLQKVLEHPGKASALALGAAGEVALFFDAAGGEAPSEREPAFLLRPNAAPLELPPWSTVRPASSPECASSAADHRVLIRAPRSWFELTQAGSAWSSGGGDLPMLALVRVSAVRYCLEAVDLGAGEVTFGDFTIPTRVIARFAGQPTAGRVGFTLGAEFRQSLSCELR
jgi:hypothetical protein